MLLQKYNPKSLAEILTNRRQGYEIKRWVSEWTRNKHRLASQGEYASKGALIISGPPGVGKDIVLEIIARELNYEIRRGAPDDLISTAAEASLWMRGKILVVDLDHGKDYTKLEALLEKSAWPVVAVTQDIYQKHLREMRKSYLIVRFSKIYPAELAGFLKKVCIIEKIKFDERALFALAKMSDGDARFCLLAIESMHEVTDTSIENVLKDSTETLFSTLDKLFARRLDEIDLSLLPIVLENVPEKYAGAQLAFAYKLLALAEYFSHKNGEYSEHFLRLLPPVSSFSSYKFPAWESVREDEEMLAEIAGKTHCSSKKARGYRVLVRE